MNKTLVYLIYFVVYSVFLLVVGKATSRASDSLDKFFVGERKMGVFRLFFTFVGTWLSAATILGFTGSIYNSGFSVIVTSVIPWFLGALLLYAISDRLYDAKVLTIPELLGRRYDSRWIQILAALVMVACYIFYLVIQIKGFGIAVGKLLNIDYTGAVFLVYLFILYSTFGGFYSVVKTDAFNLIILTVSMGVIYYVIVRQADGVFFFTESMVRESAVRAGMPTGASRPLTFGAALTYMTAFFGWGMGLATNPQYMVRMISAGSKRTAKRMILCSLAFLAVFYFVLTQIGLGLRVLFPGMSLYAGNDDVLITAIHQLMYSRLSGFFLISIIGACISTANSQLLLIGSSLSYDVLSKIGTRKMEEDRILWLTRLFVFLGGTVSLIFSFNPPADTLSYGGDIWGVFSVFFFPLVYGALYFKRGTKAGAYAAFIAGAVSGAAFFYMPLDIHWAFPATICSTAAYVLVSLKGSRKKEGDA